MESSRCGCVRDTPGAGCLVHLLKLKRDFKTTYGQPCHHSCSALWYDSLMIYANPLESLAREHSVIHSTQAAGNRHATQEQTAHCCIPLSHPQSCSRLWKLGRSYRARLQLELESNVLQCHSEIMHAWCPKFLGTSPSYASWASGDFCSKARSCISSQNA